MLHPTDIARLLAGYDCGAVRRVTQARHGFVNETAFVDTDSGPLVVRRCHPRLGEQAARYRHALTSQLAERGLPVPAPVRDREGRTYQLVGGRVWEVQPLMPGDDFDPSHAGQAESAAALLARYHAAAEGIAPPPGEPAPPRYAPRAIRALTEPLLERDVMGDLHEMLAWYDAHAGGLAARLGEAAYAALPQLVIHGDVHADNFRFCGDQAVALLDFDQAGWDSRAVDLADALVAFASVERRPGEWSWGVFSGALDEGRAQRVLAGYSAAGQLTEAERGALPVMLAVLWMRGALGRVFATPEGAPDYHTAVLAQGRELAEWAAEHEAALLAPALA